MAKKATRKTSSNAAKKPSGNAAGKSKKATKIASKKATKKVAKKSATTTLKTIGSGGVGKLKPAGVRAGLRALETPTERAADIVASCESQWEANKADCNAFARAVSADVGVILSGNADKIAGTITGGDWSQLSDGAAAADDAAAGKLVIGALRSGEHSPPREHGHVVVVVSGSLAQGKYPHAYWGSLGSVGKKNETVNYAWTKSDRDNVHYASKSV